MTSNKERYTWQSEILLKEERPFSVIGMFDRSKTEGQKYGLPILDFSKLDSYGGEQIIIAAKPEHGQEIYGEPKEHYVYHGYAINIYDYDIASKF